MDAASAFMVLGGRLVVHGLPIRPGKKEWRPPMPLKDWSAVECRSKHAYGCGEHGQGLVSGLSLHVRHVRYPDLTTSLSISLSDDAIKSIQAELGVPGGLEVQGRIWIAHRQVLVLLVAFLRRHYSQRVYYLVYDSADASLYMIPCVPDPNYLEIMYTLVPVPVRADGDGRGHELALMACERWTDRVDGGRLCLCTPAANGAAGPWEEKLWRFPELSQLFSADVVFSSDGKALWADLSQGVACCDLRAGSGGSVVDTVFIYLPEEYVIDYPDSPEPSCDCDDDDSCGSSSQPAPKRKMVGATRTMGAAAEDTVKFVCIDGRPGDETVSVLTLDLHRRRWKEDEGFPCPWIELWRQLVGSMDANAELREVEPPEPQYPVLMPDGALCLLLANVRGLEEGEDYICSFNMRSKSVNVSGVFKITKPPGL
ncbi:unnamed protein product [Urochloa decumbens]|uniref:DUF1618 domain-containing protein n=1 Tax=Urochloa decumbens TaxID=240449 RepID=A0ABC8YJ45_9POAL